MSPQHAAKSDTHETRSHSAIRRWAEERDAIPTTVRGTGKDGAAGILRLDFVGDGQKREDDLEAISWEEFFEKFDEAKLTFLYQDRTADGQVSRFCKFVNR